MDLYNYFKNPYSNIKSVRNASKYLSNKHGVLKDVLRAFKTLPSLIGHLSWSSFDNPKAIKKNEKKIFDFLDGINVRKLVRDGLYEVAEVGTVVTCLRKNKYVQFLELDDLDISEMRDGKWVVKFDLSKISSKIRGGKTEGQIIESLPDEITQAKYNAYKTSRKPENRYVELKNCHVINFDGNRNFPWGLPFTIGAWASLIQKEIIDRVERSVSDRLIKQIIIMKVAAIEDGKNLRKQPSKELINSYFNNLKSLLLKKEQNNINTNNTDLCGTGLATLPEFLTLEPLTVDTSMLSKELYEKIENSIFENLGVSKVLIAGFGEGANFSSATINAGKFYSYIFSVVEQLEQVLSEYVNTLVSNNLSCKFFFDRTTILNRKEYVDQCKEFFMQTNIFLPWAEALFGVDARYLLSMAQYQDNILDIDKLIRPAANSFTQSSDGKKAEVDNPDNEGQLKTKSNDGNNTPSPSD